MFVTLRYLQFLLLILIAVLIVDEAYAQSEQGNTYPAGGITAGKVTVDNVKWMKTVYYEVNKKGFNSKPYIASLKVIVFCEEAEKTKVSMRRVERRTGVYYLVSVGDVKLLFDKSSAIISSNGVFEVFTVDIFQRSETGELDEDVWGVVDSLLRKRLSQRN